MRVLIWAVVVVIYFLLKAVIEKYFKNTNWYKKIDKFGSFITWMIFLILLLGVTTVEICNGVPKAVLGILLLFTMICFLFCIIGFPKDRRNKYCFLGCQLLFIETVGNINQPFNRSSFWSCNSKVEITINKKKLIGIKCRCSYKVDNARFLALPFFL